MEDLVHDKALDYRLIIGEWVVQSLKALIDDGSHASFLLNILDGTEKNNFRYIMDTAVFILKVILLIWFLLFLLKFWAQILGYFLALFERYFLALLICGGIGYGIQYACNLWLKTSSLWGWPIFVYPLLLCLIFVLFKEIGNLLKAVKDIFFDSIDVSDMLPSNSNRSKSSSTSTRYNSSNGESYYQEGNTLIDSDNNRYHKDGDNVWRDYKGHSINDNDLN